MEDKPIALSDDLAARKRSYGILVFPYFRDEGQIRENYYGSRLILTDSEIWALAVHFLGLRKMLDEAIGLYLEFKDQHGYDEEEARAAAVNEILEGIDALKDIAAFEQEQQAGQA